MRANWKQKVFEHFKQAGERFSFITGGGIVTVVVQLGGGKTKTLDEPTWEAMFKRNCR